MLITDGSFILIQDITIKMFFSISDHKGYMYATPIFWMINCELVKQCIGYILSLDLFLKPLTPKI